MSRLWNQLNALNPPLSRIDPLKTKVTRLTIPEAGALNSLHKKGKMRRHPNVSSINRSLSTTSLTVFSVGASHSSQPSTPSTPQSPMGDSDEDGDFIMTHSTDGPSGSSEAKSPESPVSISGSLHSILSLHESESQLSLIEAESLQGHEGDNCTGPQDSENVSPVDEYLVYNSREIDELKQRAESLSQDLKRADTTIDEYEHRQRQDQELLIKEKDACTRLRRALDDVGSALASSQRAYSKLLEDTHHEKEALSLELNQTNEDLLSAQFTIDDLRLELVEEKGRVVASTQSLNSTRTELKSSQEAYLELQGGSSKQIDELSRKNKDLSQEVDKFTEEVWNLEVALVDAGFRHTEDEQKLNKEKENNVKIQKELDDSVATLAEVQQQYSELKALDSQRLEVLAQENERLSREADLLRSENRDFVQEMEELKNSLSKAESSLQTAENQHAEEKATLVKENTDLRESMGSLESAHAELLELGVKALRFELEKEALRVELKIVKQRLSEANATIEETERRHVRLLDAALNKAQEKARSAPASVESEFSKHQVATPQQNAGSARGGGATAHMMDGMKLELSNLKATLKDYEERHKKDQELLKKRRQELVLAIATIEENESRQEQDQEMLNAEKRRSTELKKNLLKTQSTLEATRRALAEMQAERSKIKEKE